MNTQKYIESNNLQTKIFELTLIKLTEKLSNHSNLEDEKKESIKLLIEKLSNYPNLEDKKKDESKKELKDESKKELKDELIKKNNQFIYILIPIIFLIYKLFLYYYK